MTMKPMLAVEAPEVLCFPLYASAKIDGVRAVVVDGQLLSRSMKPIPNAFVQTMLGHRELNGLDGELVVGPANDPGVMQTTMSGVMSKDGEPDFTYWVFDFWTAPTMPYSERLQLMERADRDGTFAGQTRILLLPHVVCLNLAELNAFEAHALAQGFEGVMVRKPSGQYKYGRSTAKEAHLLKVKRFVDSEALVIGFQEKMHNDNEAYINEAGATMRSTAQAGLRAAGTLGALLCRTPAGVEFGIGTGFNDNERAYLWSHQREYLGKQVTYKHFAQVGVKDAPRFPVYKGFRDAMDIS